MDHKVDEPTRQEVDSNGSLPRKKGGLMNTLYPPGPKPGAGGRMKNHCRKFWWCDLLVIAIITLIIVLPIIYVAIPNKAQRDLDASTLEVLSQEVTEASPDGIHLRIVSKAKSSSSFHPTIEGFQAGLHLEGKEPFLYINVPETKAEAETDIVVEHDVKFASLDRFTEYNKVVMESESFDVYMTGETNIHQTGLQPISVDYNKKVTMKGLNSLKGLNVTDLEILFGDKKPLPNGANMLGRVHIPNPSVMTLDLGNVTMNLSVDGTDIGTSFIPNLVLRPGDNEIPMQSTVKQITVIGLVNSKFKDAVIPLEIVGNSSVNSQTGEHLTYFEEAIKSNTVTVDMNIAQALAEIGLNIADSDSD